MATYRSRGLGHFLAIITVLIWGVTYIATDRLLNYYSVTQLMMIRFAVAYVILLLVRPRFLRITSIKDELSYLAMSAFGVIGYYYLENTAVARGGATNTSILISLIPIVTLIILCITGQKKKLSLQHFVGFLFAIAGVVLVVLNGTKINMSFDIGFLGSALGACVCWGIYSVLVGKFGKKDPVLVSRRMIFWSLLFVSAYCLIFESAPSVKPMLRLSSVLCMIVLGVFGSGLCYSFWASAISRLGVDIATNYIYVQPFITMIAAVIIGTEKFSWMGFAGAVLILIGVLISDKA